MFYIAVRHGGRRLSATFTWKALERRLSERHQDEAGSRSCSSSSRFPRDFQPCARRPWIDSRGGELGTRSAMPSGRVRQPGLIVACVVGDGEAETGPWRPHGSPISSSTQLPTEPCCDPASQWLQDQQSDLLARIEHENWSNFCEAALDACFVEGDEPEKMHELMAPPWTKPSSNPANPNQCARKNDTLGRAGQ